MDNVYFDPSQPRLLKYRSHYWVYLLFSSLVAGLVISFWGYRIYLQTWSHVIAQNSLELVLSGVYLFGFGVSYFLWFRSRLHHSVQVFGNKLVYRKNSRPIEILFSEVESLGVIYWSLFYIKMKNGQKFYFNSGLERVDYVWEGLKKARPELIADNEYEQFRVNLIQYDHHQKRKEWFFRHKLVDVFNWVFLPWFFLVTGYAVQSQEVVIHQPSLYLFRLFIYSILVLLVCGFIYSMALKILVFDRKVASQLQQEADDKIRDLEFEGLILQRSKIFQMMTSCFIFAFVIKSDLNLYSITQPKIDSAFLNIKAGKTLLIDNRYNCFDCRYQVTDGDLVVFGKGYVGQVLARAGEFVGEVAQDEKGRMIASNNVQEVPAGHLAIKAANGKDIIFIKIGELIGKIQN